MLKTRIISTDVMHPDNPLYLPHIFLGNKRVDNYNSLMYDRAQVSGRIQVVDVGLGDASSKVKKMVLASIPNKFSKTMDVPTVYKSAIDLRNELS